MALQAYASQEGLHQHLLLPQCLLVCWGGFWAGRRSRLLGAGRASSGAQPQKLPPGGAWS